MAVGNSSTPYLGYGSYLAVAEETTYATHITGTAFVEFRSESLKMEEEEILLESINTSRDFTRRLKGNITVAGSVEIDANVAEDAFMLMIKQAMGGTVSSSTLTASGSYAHTFYTGDMESNDGSIASEDIKGLTFQVRRGSLNQWSYNGMRINTMSIKGEVGAPITASFEMMGSKSSVTADSITASFSSINPLNFTGVTFNTGITISAVTAEYITGFELTLSNNLVEQRNLGSANIHALPPTRRDVKLTLSQQFDTLTAYNRYIQNTKTAIQLLMDTGVTIGGAGTSTYSMHINLPCCYFNNVSPEVSSMEPIPMELAVSVIRDTTTSYSIQIQGNNATEGY